MDKILMWLSSNPIALYIVALLLSLSLLVIIILYVIAFVQGRSISFWPPRIGEESNEPKEKEYKKIAKKGRDISIIWPPFEPTPEEIIKGAKNSILILGASLFRFMHSDFYKYRDWLEKDQTRIIGAMFINPYAPHVIEQGRKNGQRSSDKNIMLSINSAFAEAKINPQFIPVIYENHYRYSARAIDLISDSLVNNSIDLVTSSYQKGTSGGFAISLYPSKTDNGKTDNAYASYRQELLFLWKRALANPAGHGISIVGKSNSSLNQLELDKLSNMLSNNLSSYSFEALVFSQEQIHLTFTSLCRTQSSPFGKPLTVSRLSSADNLPIHFGDFLCDVIQKARDIKNKSIEVTFDQININQQGYISLVSDSEKHSALIKIVDSFLVSITELIETYSVKYPKEFWKDGIKYSRFFPKYTSFIPHITIGMIFNKQTNLPIPVLGKTLSFSTPFPIGYLVSELMLVHYAYRSLLRSIGEISINTIETEFITSDDVLHALGINKI
jgi:hypothetical protein